jgi:hypothetical protein
MIGLKPERVKRHLEKSATTGSDQGPLQESREREKSWT